MFNTVPAWHPLRLAEDFAVADLLTGGRVRFGIGRGYINREVETLGATLDDDAANRELFEEQVEIIFKAWNEASFAHRGTHYRLPPPVRYRERELQEITLVPRPRNLPVECWQPIFSASPRGIDFMVRHGIKGVVPGGARVDEIARSWQAALAASGRPTELGEDLALVVQVVMADTQEQALQTASTWYEEQLKVLAPLGRMPFLSREQVLATYDPRAATQAGLPTVRDLVRDGAWICGPPEHVYERLCEYQERLPGLHRVSVGAGALGIPAGGDPRDDRPLRGRGAAALRRDRVRGGRVAGAGGRSCPLASGHRTVDPAPRDTPPAAAVPRCPQLLGGARSRDPRQRLPARRTS